MRPSGLPFRVGCGAASVAGVGVWCILLLGASFLLSAQARATFEPCALLEGTGVQYSQVPRGWSAEAWSDSIAGAFPEESERPVVCLPPPDQGDYAIGNPIPEVGIDNLGYTARDWERWDGWDAKEDLLHTPTRFGSDNDAQLRKANSQFNSVVWGIGDGSGTSLKGTSIKHADAPLSSQTPADQLGQPVTGETYLRAFRAQLHNVMFPRGYAWFRGFQRNKDLDWIVELKKSKRLDMTGALLNVSFALNENYNNLRKSKRAAIRTRILNELKSQNVNPSSRASSIEAQIESEFDAYSIRNWLGSDMPRNQATIDWLERLLQAYIDQQCLKPGTMVMEGSRQIDAFGLFEGLDGPGYRQSLLFFYAHDWAYIAGRWIKLLRTPVIRRVRQSIYASLAASYASYLYRINSEDRLSNQWIMRVASITTSVYVVLRSEAVLKARGDWQSSDNPAGSGSTNWGQGKITNADMISLSESYLENYVNRMQRWGLTESLSTYYGLTFDILTQAMHFAPTQRCYELYERVWKMLNYDTYNNFLPAAASASGPSGRHYDVTTGLHGKQDYWDTPLYTCLLFPPNCAVKEIKERYDGNGNVETVVNLCTSHAANFAPMTVGPSDFSAPRFPHAALQAAGLHYIPFDAMFNFTVGKQARIAFALTTNQRGQERYNFFSPLGATLSIGWNGEEVYGTGTANVWVARLGGVPVPGSSRAVIKKNAPTQVHAYLRQMVDNEDEPFFRDGPYGVVSHEIPQLARRITAQHQGFALTTSLVGGRADDKGQYDSAPWSTDLVLPVTIESLWADNTRLPVTAGTVIALPTNTIITARHKGSSFAIRILRAEVSSNIKEASKISVLSSSASSSTAGAYSPRKGMQEYTLTWQVDSASLLAGCGRVTIHHKHKGDSKMRPWRVATLWGSGVTNTDAEMFSLQRTIRHAVIKESLREEGGWDATDQPSFGKPKRSWDGKSTLGQVVWSLEAQVGPEGTDKGGINLKVVRTDVYQPNTNDNAYKHKTAPLHAAPYYFAAGFDRLAQGVDDFARFFPGMEKDSFQGPSMRSQALGWDAILAPHLTAPLECVPGVDNPCYQWRLISAWSSCSASCRSGVRTRTVRCADASGSNPTTAVADSMCMAALKPTTVESCNTLACLPSAPIIERVQALDGYVRVWWRAPTDNGGESNLRYVALTAPTSVATTADAATSPMLVGPLTNGQSYTVRLAAVNSAGTGPWSALSDAVVPDKFSWKYSDWSACSRPCGSGGEQTRTVSCAGAATGPTTDDVCMSIVGAMPTDLRQSCGAQPCVWSTGDWGTCSRACSGGTQTRDVGCKAGTDGATVPSTYCTSASAPPSSQSCNTQACAWVPSTWSACSKPCGGGTQTRSLSCADGKGNTNLPSSACQQVAASIGDAPATSQSCNTQSCQPSQWITGAWSACSEKCGPGGTQTRTVECQTASGSASECPANTKPASQQSCNTASCEWRPMGDWGECSAPCNGGTRTRSVVCVEPAAGAGVPNDRCAASGKTAPASTEECNTQACAWASSPWGVCSASCGVGTQTRRVWCSDGSPQAAEIDASYCKDAVSRSDTQECGTALVCIDPPGTPTITLVEPGNERATVHFLPADNSAVSVTGVEYVVDALPDQDDGAGGGTTPVQSSFEVAPSDQPALGAFETDENGNPIGDIDAPSGALPPLAALTSFARSSPIVVLGLVNGVRYRFTIVAVNAAGSSAKSAPSEPPVRPLPPPSSPPRFLRVALPSESDPAREGDLLVYFEANHTEDAFPDTPAPFFVATAEPQIAGQISTLTNAPQASGTDAATGATEPPTTPAMSGFVDGSAANETVTDIPRAATPTAAFVASVSVNGSTSPLRLTGLDPAVQYRLTLAAVNSAGTSDRSVSQGVYRADPTAEEWRQAGFGNEAGMADVPVDEIESPDTARARGSSGMSAGEIAAAVIVPLLVAAAVGGGLFWRWQRAKDRQTGSSTQASPDTSRDASREPSRSKGPYHVPQLQPHADAAGDLEADQQSTSPLNKHPPKPMQLPPRPPPSSAAHARRRSSHVQVNIDDMTQPDTEDAGRITSRTSTQVPNFYERDNPLSPAGAAAASGIAASLGPAPSLSPSGPVASPSDAAPAAEPHQPLPYSLRSHPQPPQQSSSPTSPPARMSPPPLAAHVAAPSPSPSPSPEPQAPFLRRAPH